MKRCLAWIGVLLVATLALGFSASAAGIPTTLSYRGTMTDKAGQPLNTSKSLEFNLYDVATDGVAFWTEVQTVTITNGQFTVLLGADQANLIDLSKFGGDTWLGIRVSGEPEMTPRQKMTSVPYALNGVPKGVITMWSGSIANIPQGWALCNGQNGTPDLRDRFVVGAGNGYTVGASGGAAVTLTISQMPSHTHADNGHAHSLNALAGNEGSGVLGHSRAGGEMAFGINYWTGTGYANLVNTGGGQSHENRPPYYALAYIMKI